jgi:hypothetical protein
VRHAIDTTEQPGSATPTPDSGATPQSDGDATPQSDGDVTPQSDGDATPQSDGRANASQSGAKPQSDGQSDGNAIPWKCSPKRQTENTEFFLKKPSNCVDATQKRLQRKASIMSGYISQCKDIHLLRDIESHSNSALSTFEAFQSHVPTTILPKHNIPHNQGISQQRRFLSTRKRTKVAQIRLAKPDQSKRDYIYKNLMANTLYSGKRQITPNTRGKFMSVPSCIVLDIMHYNIIILEILKWLCLDSVIKRVLHGGYEVQELEINVQDLPDEIIDRDLGEIKQLLTREASDLLEKYHQILR